MSADPVDHYCSYCGVMGDAKDMKDNFCLQCWSEIGICQICHIWEDKETFHKVGNLHCGNRGLNFVSEGSTICDTCWVEKLCQRCGYLHNFRLVESDVEYNLSK